MRKSIVLFDGICNLCNSSVDFILKKDKGLHFTFVALQSQGAKKLIENYSIPTETDSILLIKNNTLYIESDAALEISKLLPSPWNWIAVFRIIPKKWRDSIYRWVAKNRYRWFGKRTNCRLL